MATRLPASKQRETLEKWLKRHGFTGNPFAEREAGREKRLSEYFVEGPHYDEIKGSADDPRTCFVFAGRGCGKSAYRVMIQKACRPAERQNPILAVPYTDFSGILHQVGYDLTQVTLEHHLQAILASALLTLVHEFVESPESYLQLPTERKGNFKWLVAEYASWLLRPARLADFLREWNYSDEADRLEEAAEVGPIEKVLSKSSDTKNPLLNFLAAFFSTVPMSPGDKMPPFEHFQEFVSLARRVGLEAVYVLVDRVDEVREMANNPEAVTVFLHPSVSHLPLMEMPHVAFKYFLPMEVATGMEEQHAIRFDRFPSFIRSFKITWKKDALLLMLQQRLEVYSDKRVQSLAQLADESINQTIDQDVVSWAYGSPRNLLALGDWLFLSHCGRAGDEELLLNEEDLKAALEHYEPESIPLLWVDEELGQVFRGEEPLPVGLTHLEYELLAYLCRSAGAVRSKDEIYYQVWEPYYRKSAAKAEQQSKDEEWQPEVATDQAIESLIFRLRKKIEPDPRRPIYLVTHRGRGYQVQNTGRPNSIRP